MLCYLEPNCVSINVRPSNGGKYKCELNNATAEENQLIFLQEKDSYYLAIEVNSLHQWVILKTWELWNHLLLPWREIMKCSDFWLKQFKSKKEVKLIRYLIESSFSSLMHRSIRGFNVFPGNLPGHLIFSWLVRSSSRLPSQSCVQMCYPSAGFDGEIVFAKGNISDRDFQFDFVNLFPEPSTRIGELFTFKHLYIQTIASVWR